MKTYHVAVLGASGVGKTTLVNMYINGCYSISYTPTIDDTYMRQEDVGGKMARFEIHDTGGYDRHPNLRRQRIGQADAFVLVYSYTCRQSFHDIEKIYAEIQTAGKTNFPMVLVGNCGDSRKERAVTTNHGLGLSMIWGHGCTHIEITRAPESDFRAIFLDLVNKITDNKLKKKKKNRCAIM